MDHEIKYWVKLDGKTTSLTLSEIKKWIACQHVVKAVLPSVHDVQLFGAQRTTLHGVVGFDKNGYWYRLAEVL